MVFFLVQVTLSWKLRKGNKAVCLEACLERAIVKPQNCHLVDWVLPLQLQADCSVKTWVLKSNSLRGLVLYSKNRQDFPRLPQGVDCSVIHNKIRNNHNSKSKKYSKVDYFRLKQQLVKKRKTHLLQEDCLDLLLMGYLETPLKLEDFLHLKKMKEDSLALQLHPSHPNSPRLTIPYSLQLLKKKRRKHKLQVDCLVILQQALQNQDNYQTKRKLRHQNSV